MIFFGCHTLIETNVFSVKFVHTHFTQQFIRNSPCMHHTKMDTVFKCTSSGEGVAPRLVLTVAKSNSQVRITQTDRLRKQLWFKQGFDLQS